MFDTISCESDNLTEMYQNKYIHNTILNSNACVEYGLNFLTIKKKSSRKNVLISDRRRKFILSIFPHVKIAALCNTLAIVHKKIVLNKAKRVYISDDLIINLQTEIPNVNEQTTYNNITKSQSNYTSSSTLSTDSKLLYVTSYIEPIVSQILPTKTFLNTEKDIESPKKYTKELVSIENDDTASLFIELNSTNEVPVPTPSQCIILSN